MLKLYKYILRHYGDVEDQELCDIFADAYDYLTKGEGDARGIKEWFVEWEKKYVEAGL
jgi:hypothetical protein